MTKYTYKKTETIKIKYINHLINLKKIFYRGDNYCNCYYGPKKVVGTSLTKKQ